MITLCTTFNKNEQGYKEWREQNSNGFVFNHFGNTESAKQMNKIHRADCTFLKRAKDEGKRTHPYEKICSTNLESLKEHLKIPWTYCKNCMQ